MKKHFLLLLMAFFSLTGWAQQQAQEPVDLSDGWAIQLSVGNTVTNNTTYTGQPIAPTVKLVKTVNQVETYLTTGFNVSWNPTTIQNVGEYTVTVTGDNNNTFNDLAVPTKKFFVLMATSEVTNPNTAKVSDGTDYATVQESGQAYPLVNVAPTVSFGTVLYSTDQETWSEDAPTATRVGTYNVYYKVVDDPAGNFNGFDAQLLGSVEIDGTALVAGIDYKAPLALQNNLTFDWANGAAVEQELVQAGEVLIAGRGVMKYKLGAEGAWQTTVPKASAVANNYQVYWKVEAADGYKDAAGGPIAAVIEAATPEITAGTAATLTYTGEVQNLLATVSTASLGATVKYEVRYKATANDNWGNYAEASADAKGTNAGIYGVKSVVVAEGNYAAAATQQDIEVTIAQAAAFTGEAPATAKTLTWTGDAQQLITANEGTAAIVKYSKDNGNTWSTNIETITGTAADDYAVKFKVEDANYIAATGTIEAKINKKPLSVIVNNVTKTYDGTTDLTDNQQGPVNYAIDGGKAKFSFSPAVTTSFAALTYAAITAEGAQNAGEHAGVLTVTQAALDAINANYEYTIIPGKLTVNKAKVTITANQPLKTPYGTALDISDKYTPTGLVTVNQVTEPLVDVKNQAGEIVTVGAFSVAPVLTSNAGDNPAIGKYTLSFTEGTLNNNYEAEYVIPENACFEVEASANAKIVITVAPHEQFYTGVAESWDNMVEGTDYFVSGLIEGDVLTPPTFKRSNADKFDAATYDLTTNEDASVTNPEHYPGGIIYNNSTFTIKPVVLAATVKQQTVRVGATALPDADAWSVTGMVNGETKEDLIGTLSLEGATGQVATINDGIKLTITNTNYTLVQGSEYGKLVVISANDLLLDPDDGQIANNIAAANGGEYNIAFGTKTMKAKEWYAMVLPFNTTPAELVDALGTYVVVNHLNTQNSTDQNFKFSLEMDELPAGVPFLIKPAADVDWADFDLGTTTVNNVEVPVTKKINSEITPAVATGVVTFTGTYESGLTLGPVGQSATGADRVWWLSDTDYQASKIANDWRKPKNKPHTLAPMEAYLIAEEGWTTYAPTITVEDFDGQTTAIKTLNVDQIDGLNVSEGWYNLNGVKLQGAPTQKGVYIKSGKKVIIK